MSLGNNLPLGAAERVQGSLSDILPSLPELVGANGLRKSLQAFEAAAMQNVRQLIQRSAAVPATALSQWQQAASLAAQAPLFSRISSVSIDLREASAQQSLGSLPKSGAAYSSLPATLPPDIMPALLQAQVGMLSSGQQDVWQQLLNAAPGVHQQQLLARMAHQPPAPLPAPAPVPSPAQPREAASQELHPSPARVVLPQKPRRMDTGFPTAGLLSGMQAAGQAAKRGADGEPKPKGLPLARLSSAESAKPPEPSPSADSADRAARADGPPDQSPPAGPPPAGARSSRLQLQNKQAQQRYRERKRQKVADMETQLAGAAQQAQELQAALLQNARLQERVLRLERDLAASQRDCSVLAQQAAQPPPAPAAPAPEAAAAPPPAPSAVQLAELGVELQRRAMRLEQLLQRPADGGAPAGTGERGPGTEALAAATAACLELCQRAQAEGVAACDLLLTSRAAADAASPSDRWAAILQDLAPDELQLSQLAAWHRQHLKQLRGLAEARQPVAQRVSRALDHAQAAASGAALHSSGCDDGAACRNLALMRDLQLLQASLGEQAQLGQQFSRVLTTHILSPAQAARFVAAAWPAFCDSLALTTALAQQQAQARGKAAEPAA